ncbi:SCO1 protein [Polaromonas vacuolata]|uniref:SCO1 protein n=1 Tax=Polaromonas vacuolata TaxID=37448 RepID=A0A6H2HCE1_9BURK|nr:SCO family protein [Polaromonas vacuolata]QJC57427.1 SCO1 protein [Polaromonas vacuolata]
MRFFTSQLELAPVSERRSVIKSIATYTLLAGSGLSLMACSKEEKLKFSSIDLTGADYAKNFSLPDQNGQVRSMPDFAGKIVVVFFGFVQCPDVCPTTMFDLASIKKGLGADSDKLQVIFITVDPERDTEELLKAYMANFDPSFLALRPSMTELPALAADFKVFYKKVAGKTPGSYSMDHTAGSYVYDTKGKLRLFGRYGTGPEGLASDIRLLLKSA